MKLILHLLSIIFISLFFSCQSTAATYTATTGNWSTMTWTPSGTPGASDDIIIPDGATVTLDASPTIHSLTIGQGTSGTLIFSGAAVRAVVLSGDLTINTGATFITQSATTKTSTLSLSGNLTNNGTFDMSQGGTTLVCTVTFNGTGTQVIGTTGTPALTRFYKIVVNNTGGWTAPVYPATTPTITGLVDCQIPVSIANTTTAITFTAGIFKLSSASTLAATSFSSVASAAGFWMNNASASVSIAGNWTVDGLLRLSAGTFTNGTITECSINPSLLTSVYIFDGATVNVSGEIKTATTQTTYYIFSAGTVNVATYGNTSGSGSIGVGAGQVLISGGTINLVNPNSNASPKDWAVTSTVPITITGGTLNIGTANTNNPVNLKNSKSFSISGPCPSIVIAPADSVKLSNTLSMYGNLTVGVGSYFDFGGKGVYVYGTSVENHGYMYSSTLGTSYLRFDGTYNSNAAQTYTALDGGVYGSYLSGATLTAAPCSLLTIATTGGVTVNGNMITYSLTLSSGLMTIGNSNITVTGVVLGGSSAKYVVTNGTGSLIQNVGTSKTVFPVGHGAADYTPISFAIGSAAQSYKVRVLPVIPNSGTGGIGRQWQVLETTSPGTTVFDSLTLTWNSNADVQQTLVNTVPCDIVANNTGSVDLYNLVQTGITISGTSASITLPDSGFGDFSTNGLYLSVVQNNSALPVELTSFSSNVNGRNVQLNWQTKTEQNSSKFEIERSLLSSNNWVTAGVVNGSGNSNSPKQYSFTEKNLQAGKYQYRLKMIDNNGSYQFSKIVETEIALPKEFTLNQNYPNPFNPATKISYSLPNDSKVTLDIYTISGEKVGQLVNQPQAAGYYSVDFGNSTIHKSLASGIYIYRLHVIDNLNGNIFSSVKKMILMK